MLRSVRTCFTTELPVTASKAILYIKKMHQILSKSPFHKASSCQIAKRTMNCCGNDSSESKLFLAVAWVQMDHRQSRSALTAGPPARANMKSTRVTFH